MFHKYLHVLTGVNRVMGLQSKNGDIRMFQSVLYRIGGAGATGENHFEMGYGGLFLASIALFFRYIALFSMIKAEMADLLFCIPKHQMAISVRFEPLLRYVNLFVDLSRSLSFDCHAFKRIAA